MKISNTISLLLIVIAALGLVFVGLPIAFKLIFITTEFVRATIPLSEKTSVAIFTPLWAFCDILYVIYSHPIISSGIIIVAWLGIRSAVRMQRKLNRLERRIDEYAGEKQP